MIGQHLILDIKNCKNPILNDLEKCKQVFDDVCMKYKLNILNKSHHLFQPQGISLLYLLSESHISMHSWPELKMVSLDCYTCSESINNQIHENMCDDLLNAFGGEKHRFVIIDRGFDTT